MFDKCSLENPENVVRGNTIAPFQESFFLPLLPLTFIPCSPHASENDEGVFEPISSQLRKEEKRRNRRMIATGKGRGEGGERAKCTRMSCKSIECLTSVTYFGFEADLKPFSSSHCVPECG